MFALHRAADLDEALALIDEDTVPYWGGTELLLAMKIGLLRPAGLVDLKRVPEFGEITLGPGQLVIGGGACHHRVANDGVVREVAPLLALVEGRVGNVRVRAQGSVGGNLCFAEPRSDVATVLTALDASVDLISSSGVRTLPVSEFVLGPYWTAREPNELLVRVRIPVPTATGVYRKFQTAERPTATVAAVRRTGGGVRVVVGAVGDAPLVTDTDRASDLDAAAIAAAVEPVADLAGSIRYKRHIIEVLIDRALTALESEAA
jgi:carbon-monoxide dehydrogenase medium subunit